MCFFIWIFRILFIQVLTLSSLAAPPLSGQPISGQPLSGPPLRILWYNTENLFHPSDDSLAGDDEFTPAGIRNWNDFRYRQKLTSLAKVIVAAGEGDPPELVGFCEVEERLVLEELTGHPILAPYGYRVIHRDGPDHRGTEVACIYRERWVTVSGWETIPSVLTGRGERTRDLLRLELVWRKDTLDIVMVHLISKYGGEGVTAVPRRDQVKQVVGLIDSLHCIHPGRWKVVAGDFNDPPDAWSMEPVRRTNEVTNRTIEETVGGQSVMTQARLIQVPLSGARGSYKYQGKWERIDQFLVSEGAGSYRVQGRILALPPLLTPDGSDGGVKPFRTYLGPVYQAGVSDHLPVLLEISRPFFSSDGGR